MTESIADIVLIGPVRAGKSTQGRLLAQHLDLPRVSVDELRWKYHKEIGYDETLAKEFRARGGFLALYLYWNLFDAYTAERILADHRKCVIDFGAGIYESREMLARVQRALQPYRNVILLLPSPDKAESLRILTERETDPPNDLNFDFNAHFLDQHSYYDLAKFIVYTKGKTPEETCAEILALTTPAKMV